MLARKLFMTQVYDRVGEASPVSVLRIIPCSIYKSTINSDNVDNFVFLWGIPNPKRIKNSHSIIFKKKLGNTLYKHEIKRWLDLNKFGSLRQFKISNNFIFRNMVTHSSIKFSHTLYQCDSSEKTSFLNLLYKLHLLSFTLL